MLGRLRRLDGQVFVTIDGAFLVWPTGVVDPEVIIASCKEHRGLTRNALAAGLRHEHSPRPLDPGTLARAQRDIHRLSANKNWAAAVRDAPRRFRGVGPLSDRTGAAWLAGRQERLDQCSRLARQPAVHDHWFDAILAVVQYVRGQKARQRLVGLVQRSTELGRRRRQRARRTLDALARQLDDGDTSSPLAREILDLVDRRRQQIRRGRRHRRRIVQQLAKHLGLAVHDDDQVIAAWPADEPPALLVQQIGELLLARIPSTRSPGYLATLHDIVAVYGLLFAPGSMPALDAGQIGFLATHRAQCTAHLAGMELSLAHVLAILRFARGHDLATIARMLRAGLSLEQIRTTAKLGCLKDAATLVDDPARLAAYCDWIARLKPHYARLGVELNLTGKAFDGLYSATQAGRKHQLAILAHCLVQHHYPSPDHSDHSDHSNHRDHGNHRDRSDHVARQVAELDATLGLFRGAPDLARRLIAAISGTESGRGKATHPDFAAWLDADEKLDRYLYLLELVDAPVQISRALRKDFERQERLTRERRFLESADSLSPVQEQRLAQLRALDRSTSQSSPERTRRWLDSRISQLTATAYHLTLDRLLGKLLQTICGIHIAEISPGWRDAIRFYLTIRDNRELLTALMRHAAENPGICPKRTSPGNHDWLERASTRMNLDAWLAPHERTVDIAGETHVVAVERDPLEVLRMGVPFGTCLALEAGINAAATVINAMDGNKAVVYLRNSAGNIVGRKLIAVSSDWKLIGYHVYSALGPAHEHEVETAVDTLCVELAAASELELASHGDPESLHSGFWYHDEVRPFAVDLLAVPLGSSTPGPATRAPGTSHVERYCQALGRPVPRASCRAFESEAGGFVARQDGDVEAAIACLDPHYWRPSPPQRALGDWIIQELGISEARRRARGNRRLVKPILRHLEAQSPARAIAECGRYVRVVEAHEVAAIADRAARSPLIAPAFMAAAEQSRQHAPYHDNHYLEHGTLSYLPRYTRYMDFSDLLALTDRLDAMWTYVVEQDAYCLQCRSGAESELLDAALHSYAAGPCPKEVYQCLRSRSASLLAQRVALRIAARYPLQIHVKGPLAPLSLGERLELQARPPRPAPAVVRALYECAERHGALASEPDLQTAMARHGAKVDDAGAALDPRDAMRSAVQALDDALAGKPVEHLDRALDALWTGATRPELDESIERMVTRVARGEDLPEPCVAFIDRFLCDKVTWGVPQIPRAWFPSLWNVTGLRARFRTVLAQTAENDVASDMAVVRRAASPEAPIDGLEAAWIAAHLGSDHSIDIDPESEEHARSLATELLGVLAPEQWARLYLGMWDFATASRILDVLATAPALEEIRAVVENTEVNDWNRREPVLREWLSALERR